MPLAQRNKEPDETDTAAASHSHFEKENPVYKRICRPFPFNSSADNNKTTKINRILIFSNDTNKWKKRGIIKASTANKQTRSILRIIETDKTTTYIAWEGETVVKRPSSKQQIDSPLTCSNSWDWKKKNRERERGVCDNGERSRNPSFDWEANSKPYIEFESTLMRWANRRGYL